MNRNQGILLLRQELAVLINWEAWRFKNSQRAYACCYGEPGSNGGTIRGMLATQVFTRDVQLEASGL